MISEAQRERPARMITDALADGAHVATGGCNMNKPGAFHEPTIIINVTADIAIANEEVFGPVLSVLQFSTDAQAIEIANGTPYGLVGGVFTSDLNRATTGARQLRAGQVFVNEWYADGVAPL